VLGVLAGTVSVTILIGYLTGIVMLYGPAPVGSPALPTAAGLLCPVGGIIFRIGSTPTLRKPRPLRHLLFVLGCAIVVPLLMFGTFAGSRIADAQFHQIRKDLMSEARSLSADIDREVIGEIKRLQALAASPSLRHGDFAAFQSQAEASLSMGQSGNIMLIDGDMQELANTWVSFGTPLPKDTVLKPAERALATGKPQITGIFMGPVTEELTFGIVMPVKIDGNSRYAIVRSPNPHALAGLIAANELSAGWHVAVSDATHRIITRSEQRDAFVGKELPPAQWQSAEAGGVFEFIDPAGRPSLQASVWSELTGWQTSVWAPTALLEAQVRALWWTIGLAALLALTLVIALALWLSRIIAISVSHTARAAIALGDGVPLPLSETPIAEVNTLISEFGRTAAKLWAAEGSLRESQRRLRLAQEAAGLGTWEHDFVTGRAVWSDKLRNVLGLRPDEPASRESFLSRVHPDDRGKVEKQIARARDPRSDHLYQAEFRIIVLNGPTRWLEDRGRVEVDAAGIPLRAFGVARDITARKDAEEAQARLAAIVTSSGDAIIGETLDGIVTSWNKAAERMFGYLADEMIGQSVERLIPADRQPEEDLILARLARGESIEHHETARNAKDGRAIDVSVSASPMREADGHVVGASKIHSRHHRA
jgi:PAS domain S-box-containing protein